MEIDRTRNRCPEQRPPFSEQKSPIPTSAQTSSGVSDVSAQIPALIRTRHSELLQPSQDVRQFLHRELNVSQLNIIHKHLWLAGLATGARPLHRQKMLDRKIFLTEQADLHLLWYQDRIFIKPLPTFLLKTSIWTDHLCWSPDLYADACGLLLSYAWLVCHPSDLRIGQELGLVPSNIEWERWTAFMAEVLRHVNPSAPERVSKRYEYGELRLSRLNWIHRFSSRWTNPRSFLRGYHQGPSWYSLFMNRHFGCLVLACAYFAIVLSAMQVGLATDRLGSSDSFQRASYCFAVFSIAILVVGVSFVLVVSLAMSLYYIRRALS